MAELGPIPDDKWEQYAANWRKRWEEEHNGLPTEPVKKEGPIITLTAVLLGVLIGIVVSALGFVLAMCAGFFA